MPAGYALYRPNDLAIVRVCVDCRSGREAAGRIYNSYQAGPLVFDGMFGMIRSIERLLDTWSFPQSSVRYRTFRPTRRRGTGEGIPKKIQEVSRYMNEEMLQRETGEKATFMIRVEFRQNATWQGSIEWLDEKKSQKFRSALEMIKLIDSALANGKECIIDWGETTEKAV